MDISSEMVLLIEDDPTLARLFCDALEAAQISYLSANRADAVEAASAVRPGLIVLDPGSYRMEGLGVLASLKRYPQTSDLPVAILSSNTERSVIADLRAKGIVDYWTLHDTSPEILADRVGAWLEGHRRSARPNTESLAS